MHSCGQRFWQSKWEKRVDTSDHEEGNGSVWNQS